MFTHFTLRIITLIILVAIPSTTFALSCPPLPERIVPGYIKPIPNNIFPGYSISQVIANCGSPNEQRNYQMQEMNLIKLLSSAPNVSFYYSFFQPDPGQFQSANFSVTKIIGVTDLRYNLIVLMFVQDKWIGTRYLHPSEL